MAGELIGLRLVILGAAEVRKELSDTERAVTSFGDAVKRITGVASSFGDSITRIGKDITNVGKALTFGLTVPLATLNATLVAAGIAFEDHFAGIAKTVDGVAIIASNGMVTLTEAGKELREEIRALALEIPVSANELADIGQIAGQLGVRGKEDLLTFIETVAKLGVATDLSTQRAAFGLARLQNIMGAVGTETKTMSEFVIRTSAALVSLGNNAAATESEILNLTLRLAAAGRAADLTTPEVLGIAASLAEMGVRAELGGTAVSNVIQQVIFAVADGGEQLEAFAKIAGTSAEEFAAKFKADPVAALQLFIEKLAQAQEDGMPGLKDLFNELGLAGVRVRDVLGRLGGDISIMTDNIDLATKAWEEQIALEEEATKRFATVASLLQLVKNSFIDLGIAIFDIVKDDLRRFLEGLRELIGSIKNLDPRILKFILTALGLAAVLGPVLLVIGGIVTVIGTLITAFTSLFSIGGLVAGMLAAVSGAFLIAGASLVKPADIIEFINGLLENLFQTISDLATGKATLEDLLPPPVLTAFNFLKEVIETIRNLLTGELTLESLLPAPVLAAVSFVGGVIQTIKDVLTGGITLESIFPPVVMGIINAVGGVATTIRDLLSGEKTLADVFPPSVMEVINTIQGAFNTIAGLLSGQIKMENIFPESVVTAAQGIGTVLQTIQDLATGKVSLESLIPEGLQKAFGIIDDTMAVIKAVINGDKTLAAILPASALTTAAKIEDAMKLVKAVLDGDKTFDAILPPELQNTARTLQNTLDRFTKFFDSLETQGLGAVLEDMIGENTINSFNNLLSVLGGISGFFTELGESEEFKNFIKEIVPTLDAALEPITALFKGGEDNKNGLAAFFDRIAEQANKLFGIFKDPIMENLKDSFSELQEALEELQGAFSELAKVFGKEVGPEGESLGKILADVIVVSIGAVLIGLSELINLLAILLDAIATTIKGGVIAFKGFQEATEGVRQIIIDGFKAIADLIGIVVGLIIGDMDLVKASIVDFQDRIALMQQGVDKIFNGVKEIIRGFVYAGVGLFEGFVDSVFSIIDLWTDDTLGVIDDLVQQLTGGSGKIPEFIADVRKFFDKFNTEILPDIQQFVLDLVATFASIVNDGLDHLTSVESGVLGIVDAFNNLRDWVVNNKDKLLEFWKELQEAAKKVHDLLFDSPRFKIQYGLEDLHKFIQGHDFDLGLSAIPNSFADYAAGLQPVMPALAGATTTIDRSVNVSAPITGVANAEGIPDKLVNKVRNAKVRGSF